MKWHWAALACLLAASLAVPSAAQRVKNGHDSLDDLVFASPETRVVVQQADLNELRPLKLAAVDKTAAAFDGFLTRSGGTWSMIYDRVTGNPSLVEGRGIAWLGGKAYAADMNGLDAKARAFLSANNGLLTTAPGTLVLDQAASGAAAGYLYFLEYNWTYGGIPVDKARVVFRLNHGNLVQFGAEYIDPSLSRLDPNPSLSPEAAQDMVFGYLGGRSSMDTIVDKGRLLIIPVSTPEALSGALVEPGTGVSYRLVYVIILRRAGVMGTWESRVDAHTGQVLSFTDINDYGSVHGGVFPGDRPAPEADRPMPFADLGGGLYADAGGIFSGNDATSALNGKYVKITDQGCGGGAISLSTTTGDLNFGTSSGTDCVTPGFGGEGNTHAARTQYYAINLIKMKALTYMPGNAWLNGQVNDNVNLNQVCNAYWDGTSLNFFKSGTYMSWVCSNTGEIPGVALHEWGHGMDTNDGNGSSPDNGTGETYGDWSAALQSHTSCGGNGFFIGSNCDGYGNPCSDCTGIRDLDWAKHTDNTPAIPTMLNASSGFACWLKPSYAGPCGYEGHCESAISSQALWDLSARDLVNAAKPYGLDQNSAWILADKLWYRSRSTATAAYACPSLATTNGCGAGNLFTVFRVVDDDDGDLSNGTPHASAIYDAFNRHAIACTTVNNTDHTGCTAITAPTLGGSSGSNSNSLSWNTVAGAATYDLYRNESGCDAGYTKIYSGATASYVDNQAIDGMVYYYRVQAIGSNIVCTGLMSNCVALSPSTPSGVMTGTVRDSVTSTPLAGVAVQAVSGSYNYVATTNASGVFTMPLVAVGTYDMTATVFGYLPGSATGVSVTLGNTTTQDFVLAAAPNYAVTGTVTDANTGWGLYASIHITTPGWAGMTTFTDLATGAYSVTLTAGSTYTFTVTSRVPGYNTGTASVGPVAGPTTQNFALDVNNCGAPGYTQSGFVETWDSVTAPALPAGWATTTVSGSPTWFTNAGTRHPSGGGTISSPNVAVFNSFSASSGQARLYRTAGVDLSAIPSPSVSFYMYHDTGYTSDDDNVQMQVSTDGGTTWQNVGSPVSRYDGTSGWASYSIPLTGFTGPVTDVLVGFLGTTAYGNDCHLDNVIIGASCSAPAGGLIVGFVSDAATSNAIAGASVVNATTAFTGTSDTEGFYAVYAAAGANALTASKATYADGTAAPTGVAHATVRQDFNLSTAGQVTVTGTVTDAVTGWPLYATLAFSSSGLPTQTVYTNPLTGAYSVTLFSAMVYNVGGTAYMAGYTPLATTIGPLASTTTQNYTMAAAGSCTAPGYTAPILLSENFDGVTAPALPAGWAMTRTAGTDTSTAWTTNAGTTHPSGGGTHSGPNVARFNSYSASSGNAARLYRSDAGVNLTGIAGPSLSFWMYHDTGYTSLDLVQVQVSTDAGSTWQNMGTAIQRYTGATGWAQHSVILAGISGDLTDVRLGFNAISAYGNDCYIDDVVLLGACSPPAGGGLIFGNTYDASSLAPVAGTTVTDTTSGTSAVTAATPDPAVDDAFYCIYGADGANAMTAYKANYGSDAQTATVPHYGAVQRDFHLATGRLAASPATLEITLPTNSTGTQPLTLQNVGGADVHWSVFELLGHVSAPSGNLFAKGLTRPSLTKAQMMTRAFMSEMAEERQEKKGENGKEAEEAGRETAAAQVSSIGLAPVSSHPGSGSPAAKPLQQLLPSGVTAYAINLSASGALVSFDPATPGTFTTIGTTGLNLFGGHFYMGDFSKMYCLDYTNNHLVTVNTTTAAVTVIGSALPVSGDSWTGLTCSNTGTMYASSTNITTSTLYTLNPATGAATTVGQITNAPGIIDIAINPAGQLYGLDIVNDVLVSINPATGAGTVVGPLGYNANYAQGMSFEEVSGTLYIAAYGTSGELRTCNTSTGATTLVGAFSGGAEVDCLSFATFVPADIPWLDESIKSGTVPASGSQPITVSYNTAGLAQGDYLATLSFNNDTPYGHLNVPVTLHVVNCPALITFLPTALPAGNTRTAYNQTITATSTPAGDTFTFTLTAGALPPGLAFSAAGALTGTPTLVGTYTFTVTATDPVGCVGNHQYTLVVSGYDMSFKDDNGRSSACVDSKTGDWMYNVLSGAGRGVYTGKGTVSKTSDRWTFRSAAGSTRLMLLTYYPKMFMATGSYGGSDFVSQLSDRNTKDTPFNCSGH